MNFFTFRRLRTYLCIAIAATIMPYTVAAQRDYFTPEEVELIRDAQQIDRRIDVLTRAIDRRFEVLRTDLAPPKLSKKEAEKWGVLPDVPRHEHLYSIKKILQKAIDDIDNLVERPDSAVTDRDDQKPKSTSELVPKALRKLAAAATGYQPILRAELDKTNNKAEQGSILDALDMCGSIIAALDKLPAMAEKKKSD